MAEDAPVVVIDNLTKKYGELTAVDSLSLSLSAGQILGFIGPNGAGKTTTIRMLLGQLKPNAGQLRILGLDVARQTLEVRRRVGYLAED